MKRREWEWPMYLFLIAKEQRCFFTFNVIRICVEQCRPTFILNVSNEFLRTANCKLIEGDVSMHRAFLHRIISIAFARK